jgi:putative transcriptional regulator
MAPHEARRPRSPAGFLEGKLLIATPGMSDPRFERSVVFMCLHSEDGAMGLIVNKPFEGLGFRDLLQRLEIPVSSNRAGGHVLFGGPVETSKGFVLHSGEYGKAEATLSMGNVALTATRDILCEIAKGAGPQKWLFALGYAGWGAQQLEAELGATNGWVYCDADDSLLFGLEHGFKWRAALGKLGIDISGFSAEAGRA